MGGAYDTINMYLIIAVEKLEGRKLLERPGRRWRIIGILKLISKKQGIRVWTGFIWLRIWIGDGLL
jgi:hypothetical protein